MKSKRFQKKSATVEVLPAESANSVTVAQPMPVGFSPDWHGGLPALALVVVTFFFYLPALQGGFLWDDDTYIAGEKSLRTWQGLQQIWLVPGATEQYYPLSFTVFWSEYHLWGLNTLGYHLVNVLLHGITSVLLWQVLAGLRVRGALLAGALFALHPVNVMSVAWMTELKNTLSGCLALGAAWSYVRFAGLGVYEIPGGDRTNKTRLGLYLLSLVLFLLAMLAKTAVSFLPVTLLLIVWWQKKRMTARDAFWLIPMAAITVGMGLLTIYVEQHSGGASGPDFQLGFIDRVLVSGRSFWFYLGKLLFPCDLIFIYPRWHIDPTQAWQYLYPLATVGLLAGLWLARDKLGKGVWVAFMHYYMTTSMLVLMVVLYMMRYSFVSDHWQYFGAMGMLGLFAAGLTAGWDRFGPTGKPWGIGVSLGLLTVLGMLTWQQCRMYTDINALWTDTLAKNPNCWMGYANLGVLLKREGHVDEAIAIFQKALELNPRFAEAHSDLSNAFLFKGHVDQAIAEAQKALEIDPDNAQVHFNLGTILQQVGRIDEAIAHFQKALEIDPNFSAAHANLGIALCNKGQIADAIIQFQEDVRLNPYDPNAQKNLAKAQAMIRQTPTQK